MSLLGYVLFMLFLKIIDYIKYCHEHHNNQNFFVSLYGLNVFICFQTSIFAMKKDERTSYFIFQHPNNSNQIDLIKYLISFN